MFELALPWILLGIPLPILLWYFLPSVTVQFFSALRVPFFQDVANIVAQEQDRIFTQGSLSIPILIWMLLLCALAGPRWVGEPRPIERESYNLMMVMDLSGSMEINDMVFHGHTVSRLAVVKQAAEQFVRERVGDKIGLILFGTRAYVQTPLTYDRHNVLERLADATPGLAGQTTSIGDAIGLAVKRLMQAPKQGRVMILLTDGANNSGILAPLKAAELAKNEHIKIYTIGLGAEEQVQATMLGMMQVGAELDEGTLQKIASMTGGQYFRATDPTSLEHIYETINQLERVQQEHATLRPQKEYYPWCVACALFLSLIWLGQQLRFQEVKKHFSFQSGRAI